MLRDIENSIYKTTERLLKIFPNLLRLLAKLQNNPDIYYYKTLNFFHKWSLPSQFYLHSNKQYCDPDTDLLDESIANTMLEDSMVSLGLHSSTIFPFLSLILSVLLFSQVSIPESWLKATILCRFEEKPKQNGRSFESSPFCATWRVVIMPFCWLLLRIYGWKYNLEWMCLCGAMSHSAKAQR